MAGIQIPNCSCGLGADGEPIEVDLCSEPAFTTNHCTPDCQEIQIVWHKPDCDADAVVAGHILPDGAYVAGPYAGPIGDCTACSGGGLVAEKFCAFDAEGNKVATVKVVCDFSDPTNPVFTVYDLEGNEFTAYDSLDCCPEFTVQWECLCDDGVIPAVSFMRAYGWDPATGTTEVLEDVDLDGAPYTLIGDAVKCDTIKCETVPLLVSYFGDVLPVDLEGELFNTFSIVKPDCCELIVTTNVGTFTMTAAMTGFSPCDFPCAIIESIELSGDCDLSQVNIILQRTKE